MHRSLVGALAALLTVLSTAVGAEVPRWSAIPNPAPAASAFAMGGADPEVLLVRRSGYDPVRTTDGGATWREFTVLGLRPDRFIASPTDARVFYALEGGVARSAYGGTDPSGLYRSNDAGASWERLARPFLSGDGAILGNICVGASPALLYALRMVPSFCMIGCIHEGQGAFVSSDGGRTWRPIDAGLNLQELYPSISDPGIVYAKSYRGIYRSADQGASWRLVRPFATYTFPRQVVVDRKDPMTVYVRPTDGTELWVTEDGGETWRDAPAANVPGPAKSLVPDPDAAGRLFFVGYQGQVFETNDRARSWKRSAASSDAVVVGESWREYRDLNPMMGVRGTKRILVGGVLGEGMRKVELDESAFHLGSDLWWTPSEPGSGLTITQHASGQVFVVWFTYDARGEPTWYVIPGGSWFDARSFVGTIYVTRGPAYFAGPFDASRVEVTAVGAATIAFSDDSNAIFTFQLPGGVRGEKAITRQLFGPPNDWNIQNVADLWWNAAESGWGLGVSQQWGKVFATWFVYDAEGHPTWLVLPNTTYSYDIEGPYRGMHRLSGELYATRGSPPGATYDPARFVATKVGAAAVTMKGLDEVILRSDVFGRNETRILSRQPF